MQMLHNMGGANDQATAKAVGANKCGVMFESRVSPAQYQNQNNQCSQRTVDHGNDVKLFDIVSLKHVRESLIP